MSAETLSWLNSKTLIGKTDERGRAWHYRADEQGSEPNHYPGFIPVADVSRRLFDWEVVAGDVTSKAEIITADGVLVFSITDPDRKTMMRPPGTLGPDDPGAILGVFKSGYNAHQYLRWLLEEVAAILYDELGISSAGLLGGAAIAWVEVSIPKTITTPSGVTFRPNLLATTSFDGSIATTYKRTAQDTVCDNTRAVALASDGETFKVKHSRNSNASLIKVRDALALVHTIADEFTAQVEQLCNTTVTDAQFDKFLASLAPIPEEDGRSKTMAENKQATLRKLWNTDTRVAPWRGTAHGVMQAVNTYVHHEGTVRGATRTERNMLNAVKGEWDKLDQSTHELLTAAIA